MASAADSDVPITEPTVADEQQSFHWYQEVGLALKPSIDAAKSGGGALFRSTFDDHAHIVGSIDLTFQNPDADAFGKAIANGGPSPDAQHRIA